MNSEPPTITRLPDESDAYSVHRDALLVAEIELMRQQEKVAELRRALPPGPDVDDYSFLEGPGDLDAGDDPVREVRLSELFSEPSRALVIYHFMYGKAQTTACPMCTAWIDGFNGVAHHLAQNLDLAIVAAAPISQLRSFARERGWHRLRLLSAGTSSFKFDLGSEDADGKQDSEVSVFTKSDSDTVSHRYSAHPWFNGELNQRGIDLLNPIWQCLDLTPQGRGDWYSSLEYGA